MDFRSGLRPFVMAAGLVVCGVGGTLAWQTGAWGLTGGITALALWLCIRAVAWRNVKSSEVAPAYSEPEDRSELDELVKLRLLLNAIPTPLVSLHEGSARALNTAARMRFGSADRILHLSSSIFNPRESHVSHEGRTWSVMRLEEGGGDHGQSIVALIDIEQTESVAEARAISELLQTMGHELMNGLAPIVSLAESAKKAHASSERNDALVGEILGTLVRQIEGLQRFINGYRKLSRLPVPAKREVALSDFIEDIARLFRAKWPNVSLRTEMDAGIVARFDRDQISQAVWAILQNAVEAIAETGRHGEVIIAAKRNEKTIQLKIADDGPGIPADRIDYVFRPFHSTKLDGSGIGLGFARTIAMAHGGTLLAHPGKGATFQLTIPAA